MVFEATRRLTSKLTGDDGDSRVDGTLETASHSAFYRLWRGFMTARVLIALLLLLFQVMQRALNINHQLTPLLVCIGYFCATVAVRLLAKPTPKGVSFDRQFQLASTPWCLPGCSGCSSNPSTTHRCWRCQFCWRP